MMGRVMAVLAAVSLTVLVAAAPARAQECVVGGTPVEGEVCPSATPTPSPSPSPSRTPTPEPTQTRTARPTPRPTTSDLVIPPLVPLPTPSPQGTFGPAPDDVPSLPPFPPVDRGYSATGPGLPVAPGDGRGLMALIVGMLGAGATGAVALIRARVRSWMIGI